MRSRLAFGGQDSNEFNMPRIDHYYFGGFPAAVTKEHLNVAQISTLIQ